MSEEKGPYVPSLDDATIMARLLKVFTKGQLLKLADRMEEVKANRFGGVEVLVDKHRMRFRRILSDDEGTVAWVEEK